MSTSARWRTVLLVGLVLYGLGAIAGFMAERWTSNILVGVFLSGIFVGSIASLVGCVALSTHADAGSAIAGGLISLFLAFFVPMTFEHFGGSANVHSSVGITLMFFGAFSGLGGLILVAVGFVRMAAP